MLPSPAGHAVIGNVIFVDQPTRLHCFVATVSENMTGTVTDAADHLVKPGTNQAP